MSVAGTTNIVGYYESSPQLLSSDNKGKARIPSEATRFDTLKSSSSQVSPLTLVSLPCEPIHSLPQQTQPTQDLGTLEQERPFVVRIDRAGVLVPVLEKLNEQLRDAGKDSIFSKKQPVTWIGHELTPGTLGLISHGGKPKLLTKVR